MKLRKFVCLVLVVLLIICALVNAPFFDFTASADDSFPVMASFPVCGEVVIEDFSESSMPDDVIVPLKMHCDVSIQWDGSIQFTFVADEPFLYRSTGGVQVTIRKSTQEKAECSTMCFDLPSWYPRDVLSGSGETSLIATGDPTALTYFYFDGVSSRWYYSYLSGAKSVSFRVRKGTVIGTFVAHHDYEIIESSRFDGYGVLNVYGLEYFLDGAYISVGIGSYAVSKRLGSIWHETPAMVYVRGDLNADGQLTIADVLLLRRFMYNGEPKFSNPKIADMNLDGGFGVDDYALMIDALCPAEG